DFPEYEKLAQHSEQEGKIIRKTLWRVFWVLLVVTIIELTVGIENQHFSDLAQKIIFIFFTVFKAYYIVYSFMHLGHEVKPMRRIVLVPYITFILYLVTLIIIEGSYQMKHRAESDKANLIEKTTAAKE
ncbi:MAG TPA: cytochrome C oxidase subunit IV family protein, partial [Bacteroidia bacterium]|nr:cytochrome C oxidase subunit IV family protein [Bacteroidia bacterium]